MKMMKCPKCGTPQFFYDDYIPEKALCVNLGFQRTDPGCGRPIPACDAIYSTEDVRAVTLRA